MGKWIGVAVPAVLLLAGCSQAPVAAEDEPPALAGPPLETLTFNRTVHILQAGLGLANARLPPDESCLAIDVTRGWIPVRFEARQTWEAQSMVAQELWLAMSEDDDSGVTVAAKGPSPVHLSHEWFPSPSERYRVVEGGRNLAFIPSESMAGAVVQQEVHIEVAVTFAKYPEFDDVPHAVPCNELL